MGDTFQWAATGGGTFDLAGNWTDETTPGNTAYPGTADSAFITGPGSGTALGITGPADVSLLALQGLDLLSGSFTAGRFTVDGPTAGVELAGTLTAPLGVLVGDVAQGALTVDSGSTVSAGSSSGVEQLVIGDATGSSGTISVDAGGQILLTGPAETTDYGMMIGGSGAGTLVLSGSGAGVSEAGSQDGVAVGFSADSSGSLLVSNGATASFGTTNSDELAAVSVGRGGAGTIAVDGSGSRLDADGSVNIGRGGTGSLIVSDAGVFAQTNTAEPLEIGYGNSTSNSHVGGTGSATVTTDGTLFSAHSILVGGDGVSGTLTASGGGLVTAVTQLLVGDSATVDSTFETGNGTVDVEAASTVSLTGVASPGTSAVLAGVGTLSSGVVNVAGTGALLAAGSNDIVIGYSGSGTLSVSGGGTVTASAPAAGYSAMVVGEEGNGIGTLSVSGLGSTVALAGALTVGLSGSGSATLSAGGQMTVTNVYLGYDPGGVGSLEVSGASSTLSANGAVNLGGATSRGTLAVAGGALVSALNVSVGPEGNISLAGGTVLASNSAANGVTLTAASAVNGFGTIAGAVGGPGTITASGGTLTLTRTVGGGAVMNIAAGADLNLIGGVDGSVQVAFGATGGELSLTSPAAFDATVSNFASGDMIAVLNAASIVDPGGNAITLESAGGSPLGTIALAQSYAADAFVDNAGTIAYAPCFCAGTRIATPRGAVAVEALHVGDAVALAGGGTAPVVWLGHRSLDCARHPRPWDVLPVRVRAHAFGPGQPRADLMLSPDHAVFQDGHLIPIRYLVNGATVLREAARQVTYWHVELARHGLLLAEGLPCESYLDTGNRAAFAEGGGVTQLHPDFAFGVWRSEACAPLARDGAVVAAARARLLAAAARLGHVPTRDPHLRVVADGTTLRPCLVEGRLHRFAIRRNVATVRVRSRSGVPCEIDARATDARRLGVMLERVRVFSPWAWHELPLEGIAAGCGLHAFERADGRSWRWTDGDAILPLPPSCAEAGVLLLDLEIGAAQPSWDAAPAVRRERMERAR